jgi:hypothetical protein
VPPKKRTWPNKGGGGGTRTASENAEAFQFNAEAAAEAMKPDAALLLKPEAALLSALKPEEIREHVAGVYVAIQLHFARGS